MRLRSRRSAASETALKGTSNSGGVEFIEEKKLPHSVQAQQDCLRLLIDENEGGKPLTKLEPATITRHPALSAVKSPQNALR